jgi:hypothetical protein
MIGQSALQADFDALSRLDFSGLRLTNCYVLPVPWLKVGEASSKPGEALLSASARGRTGAAAIDRRFGVRHDSNLS